MMREREEAKRGIQVKMRFHIVFLLLIFLILYLGLSQRRAQRNILCDIENSQQFSSSFSSCILIILTSLQG